MHAFVVYTVDFGKYRYSVHRQLAFFLQMLSTAAVRVGYSKHFYVISDSCHLNAL